MSSIFGRYSTKRPIELDVSLVNYVEEIQRSLFRPKNYEEIRALLKKPNVEVNLADPWYVMFYFIAFFAL